MRNSATDVIIVGAGAAGLAAADVLSAHNKSAVILEARDRLGGRIDTRHDPAWPIPIERGAEFIHGKPKETWDIIHAPDNGICCAYDVPENFSVYSGGKLRADDGFFEEVEKVLALAGRVKVDMSFNACVEKFGKRFSAEVVQRARAFVSGFDAADPDLVSCRWLTAAQKASDKIQGDLAFRLKGGYDSVVRFLESGLKQKKIVVVLNSTVGHIEWAKGSVRVTTNEGIYEATKLLVTVPISILQAPEFRFEPALPAWKRKAIDHLKMGAVTKVILRFKQPFWEEKHPDLNFFVAPHEAIRTWWTTLPLRTAVLTGWTGGPAGLALGGKTTDEILQIAFAELARVLKIPRRKIQGEFAEAHVTDWQNDPFARGAYSYAVVGGVNAARELAKPIEDTLYFAGEAAHDGMAGTVAGAIASGRKAASAICQ